MVAATASTTGGAAAFGRADAGALPPPAFRASSAWWTLTTGSRRVSPLAPQVWAITARSNLAALEPFAVFNGVRRLSRDGVVIWASTLGRGGPTHVFTRTSWPLRLPTFRLDKSWEGQPARNIQQRLRWVSVGGWRLEVRVYFGTQHPSPGVVSAAQAELNRLQLPTR